MGGKCTLGRHGGAARATGSLLLLATLVACGTTPRGTSSRTSTPATATRGAEASSTCSPTTPARYSSLVVAHGFCQPDDLTLDAEGRLLFADLGNGSVNRLAPDGRVSSLVSGLPEPEGVIALPDGTLLIAVQGNGRDGIDEIVRLAPGAAAAVPVIRFTNTTGNPGLDGISRDPRTGDLLVADSPNGTVYRVSLDGTQSTRVARGFVRPTDAIADGAGTLYVADEYGNAVVSLAPGGALTTLARIPLPDDLAFDRDGSLLVTSLGKDELLRLDPASGRTLGMVATALRQPQGLAVDAAGNVYVSEQQANMVIELRRECA
jgi:serine/threonine-protein kinase